MGLSAAILSSLTDDLRRAPWRGSANALAGHCYVASEALWHLLGRPSDQRPHVLAHEGSTHWYLDGPGGRIDLTASQFRSPPRYEEGRGCGFLTKQPSKRAQVVIDRVKCRHSG